METEIIPAPATNGHADGYRRLSALESQVAALAEQLRDANDRIAELEDKLSVDGFLKFLKNVQFAEASKKLEDPEAREQFLKQLFGT